LSSEFSWPPIILLFPTMPQLSQADLSLDKEGKSYWNLPLYCNRFILEMYIHFFHSYLLSIYWEPGNKLASWGIDLSNITSLFPQEAPDGIGRWVWSNHLTQSVFHVKTNWAWSPVLEKELKQATFPLLQGL
jgi:hypothetical protein